jgi:hypothetical protein
MTSFQFNSQNLPTVSYPTICPSRRIFDDIVFIKKVPERAANEWDHLFDMPQADRRLASLKRDPHPDR